jgi:hypothetical protein
VPGSLESQTGVSILRGRQLLRALSKGRDRLVERQLSSGFLSHQALALRRRTWRSMRGISAATHPSKNSGASSRPKDASAVHVRFAHRLRRPLTLTGHFNMQHSSSLSRNVEQTTASPGARLLIFVDSPKIEKSTSRSTPLATVLLRFGSSKPQRRSSFGDCSQHETADRGCIANAKELGKATTTGRPGPCEMVLRAGEAGSVLQMAALAQHLSCCSEPRLSQIAARAYAHERRV